MEAAGEGPSGLTASFSAEEQGLIERLRAKYSTGPAPAPAPAPPPAAAAAAAAAQPAACRLCAECYGKGMVAETYNHRTLERCCTQCGGQGTVRNEGGSGGGSSTHSGSGGSTHNVRSSAQSGGTHSSSSSAKGVHERLAGWEAELEALKQSLAGVSDAQELQLTAALILELERAAAALRKGVAAAKQEGQEPPPMTQGLAHLSLGGSAGEESKHCGGPDAASTGEEGAARCCPAAADPAEASSAASGAAGLT